MALLDKAVKLNTLFVSWNGNMDLNFVTVDNILNSDVVHGCS